jgi:hypothetical protein
MGQTDGKRLEDKATKSDRHSTRGSTNNSRRLDLFANERGHGKADWGNCDPARLQAIVVGIGGLGGAVTFGYSRDGGAHFLTLLLDSDRTTLWFNGDTDLDEELNAVLEKLEVLWQEAVGEKGR